jgi:5-methylcytosine-specific restriction endonuclease McrA
MEQKRKRACRSSCKEKGRQRRSLVRRDGALCFYCKKEMILPEDGRHREMTEELRSHPMLATLDHRHPISQGGRNTLDNLCLCCQKCNTAKGDMTEEEFRSGALCR